MRYVYDYLYLSILFLSVISFRYFSQRHFPSLRNRLFTTVLVVAIIDLFFDIFSSKVIEDVMTLPNWVTLSVCYFFYMLQNLFPVLMFVYVVVISGKSKLIKPPLLFVTLLPGIVSYVALGSNLFSQSMFYIDPVLGYMHGDMFGIQYVNSAIYILATYLYTIRHRKSFIPLEWRTVLAFLTIVSVFMALQIYLPSYLLTGASIALALTLMYIVMQKPEDMIDAVSGAFNHSAMMLFTQARMDDDKPVYFIVLELLYMRRINRLLGIAFGSGTLRAVADEMHEASPSGWVFRGIGNIFVLASASAEEHERAYAKLCERFDGDVVVNDIRMTLTATILSIPDTGAVQSANDLDECVENALMTVPRGSHRVIANNELVSEKRRDAVEDALFKAVKDDALCAYLQPIYAAESGAFETAEALARFPHKTMGMIPPSEFIEIAEKNGLILKIDEQIIRKVCAYIKQRGKNGALGLTAVEVNLSPIEFLNEQFCDRLIEIVDEYGVDPSVIWFEITESGVNADFRLLSASMSKLGAKGFRFVLDDYGIGYSNISRIMNLPFSVVKLDRSMMLDSMQDSRKSLVLRSTITMFKELDLLTVVEGVETQEQADAMLALGVDYIQGFFYARPMPLDGFTEFMDGAAIKRI